MVCACSAHVTKASVSFIGQAAHWGVGAWGLLTGGSRERKKLGETSEQSKQQRTLGSGVGTKQD